HDSTERVEIPPAVLVPNVLHFPFHKHERLFVVEENSRIQEFLAHTRHFIRRWAAVSFRLVAKGWKRRLRFHWLSLWPETAIWQGCSVWQSVVAEVADLGWHRMLPHTEPPRSATRGYN